MERRRATKKDAKAVQKIVQETVKVAYASCYSKEIIDFFFKLHSLENIEKDIEEHDLYLIYEGETLVGTGCKKGDYITRVYILPEHEKKGYGKFIMDFLEEEIKKEFDTVYLDPSFPALEFYKKRGYVPVKTTNCDVEGKQLEHSVYKKKLK